MNIAPGVVIGQTNRGRYQGAPIIGDRVWIGVHAIIVGGIRVGPDALIAPGAYVNRDVPECAVVIGNPGRIVSYEGSAGYVNWPVQSDSSHAQCAGAEAMNPAQAGAVPGSLSYDP